MSTNSPTVEEAPGALMLGALMLGALMLVAAAPLSNVMCEFCPHEERKVIAKTVKCFTLIIFFTHFDSILFT
jgi:hypothetical protein